MNNKPIFSLGLYREGLRQLKLYGILVSVLFSVITALVPLVRWIEYISYTSSEYGAGEPIIKQILGAMDIVFMMPAVYMVAAPIAVIILFSFLNKRANADFYHSIPHTRVCLYLSFLSAALTWVLIIMASVTLVGIGANALLHKYLIMTFTDLPLLLFITFAGSVLTMGCAMLAMSITGTAFNNFILFFLILFAPRIFFWAVSLLTVESSMIGIMGGLMDLKMNLVINFFAGLMESFSVRTILNGAAGLYSLLLGIFYLGSSCALFHFRKSETATKSAPNRILQAVYRISITTIITAVAVAFIYADVVMDSGFSSDTIVVAVIFYVIALIAYFFYEILTTKRWKNLVKAIPGLGIVLLLDVVIFAGMYIGRTVILSYTPSAEQIKGVYLYFADESIDYSNIDYRTYMSLVTREMELTSPEVKTAVAKALAENVASVKDGSFSDKYERYYWDTDGEDAKYERYSLRIVSASGSHLRKIYIPAEDAKCIEKDIKEHTELPKLWTTLPEPIDGTVGFYVNPYGSYSTFDTISDKDRMKLFETFKEEVASLDYESWKSYLDGSSGIPRTGSEIGYSVQIGRDIYSLTIEFDAEITPKTYALALELIDQSAKRATEKCVEYFDASLIGQKVIIDCNININYYVEYDNEDGDTYGDYQGFYASFWREYGGSNPLEAEYNAIFKEIYAFLKAHRSSATLSAKAPYCEIYFWVADTVSENKYGGLDVTGDDDGRALFVLDLDDKAMAELNELSSKYNDLEIRRYGYEKDYVD